MKKVKLLDTGQRNQTIAVVLPSKDYKSKSKPTKDKNEGRKQYFREYRQRPEFKKHHREYVREWQRRNPDKVKAIMKRHYDKKKLVSLRNNQKGNKNRRRNN